MEFLKFARLFPCFSPEHLLGSLAVFSLGIHVAEQKTSRLRFEHFGPQLFLHGRTVLLGVEVDND